MSSLLIKPTSPRRVLRTGKSKKRGPKGYCRLICPWEKIRRETLFLCLVSEVGFRVPSEDIRVNAPVPHGKLVGHQPRHEDCFSPPNHVSTGFSFRTKRLDDLYARATSLRASVAESLPTLSVVPFQKNSMVFLYVL